MKVLQIIDVLNRGGAERVLVDLSNLLFRRGHVVDVLTLVEEGPLGAELSLGIRKLNLYRRNKYSLATARRFIKIVNSYDIVHFHMRHVLRYYFFASLFYSVKTKVVFHDHWGDIDFNQSVPFHLRYLRNKIFYIGVSKQLLEWAKKKVLFNQQRVFLLTNIVAMDFVERKSQVSGGKILLISNFRRTKNIQFALEVVCKLSKSQVVSLDIYGRDQDLDYLRELQSLTKELGIESNVRFVINANAREFISDYCAAIHTASSETGPLVLIEYLANQIPFLSYSTGEVSAQLSGYLPLYFKNDFNLEGWVSGMSQLLSGKSGYPVEYLRNLYITHYSYEQYVSKCEKIYETILINER